MKPRPPLAPRKHLGQNFLVDPKAQQRILAACQLQADEEVIEIGPGLGHLTELILPFVKKIYAIEKDPRFCEQLTKKFPAEKFTVFDADVLKFDFTTLPPGLKVIGNLPYYISTPIIEKLIGYQNLFPQCFFTVQQEFAQRLAAKPNHKNYGSLSCFVQYYADIEILFKLPPSSFKPAPKVTSCFMRLNFRPPPFKVNNEDKLFTLIRTAFGQRRKRISNSLKPIFEKNTLEILKHCRLTGEERAENLSLKNYVDLITFAANLQTND
ncbi:MAG: ribosomal RNA small subunit methyltransferase A [Candidatus Omnitrophica bacterium]|nr:ribosomal RNA small subunit methyltransferase A [Candidatus Omnitrophota bacterium]